MAGYNPQALEHCHYHAFSFQIFIRESSSEPLNSVGDGIDTWYSHSFASPWFHFLLRSTHWLFRPIVFAEAPATISWKFGLGVYNLWNWWLGGRDQTSWFRQLSESFRSPGLDFSALDGSTSFDSSLDAACTDSPIRSTNGAWVRYYIAANKKDLRRSPRLLQLSKPRWKRLKWCWNKEE